MDRRELVKRLEKLCFECDRLGYPIKIDGTSEAYSGASNNSYFVHIQCQEWADFLTCAEMLDVLIPIVYDHLDKEVIRHIFALDVYNTAHHMNCHYQFTFEEYEMAC
jgi:hypothetical protein